MINNSESNNPNSTNPPSITDNDNLLIKSNEDEPIYIMTIELEHGNSTNIKIYLDSKPEELSFEFCKQNNLDFPSMSYLTKQIRDLITNFANSLKEKNEECILEEDEESKCQYTNETIALSPHNMTVPSILSSSSIACSKGKITPIKLKENSQKKQKQKQKQKQLLLSSSSNESKFACQKKTKDLSSKDKHKLCSYEYFFKTFKEKSKQNKSVTIDQSKTTNYRSLSKTNSLCKVMSKSNNLDDNIDDKPMKKKKHLISKGNKKKHIELEELNNIRNEEGCKDNNISITTKDNNNNKKKQNEYNLLKSSIEKNKTISSTYTQAKNKGQTNYGEKLYEKGLEMKAMSNQKISSIKERLEKDKKLIYTFKPFINSNTDDLIKERKTVSCTDESYIKNYKTVIQEQFDTLKQKHPQEVYSHQPQFNKRSLQLEHKKKLTSFERINRLYRSKTKSKLLISRISKEMYEECSFIPQTNYYTPKSKSFVSYSFKDRLEHYRSQSQEKKNKLYEEVSSSKDNITGQELFHPLLYNRTGGTHLKSKPRNVYSSLYSYAARYELSKSLHQDSKIQQERNDREVKISQNSKKILHTKKKLAFDEIYKLIDCDEDNYINVVNMDMNRLPSTITIIIKPIIDEMQERNLSLDKEEFNHACMNLYDILSVNDRETLISFQKTFKRCLSGKGKSNEALFPFKPKINKNSRRLANSSYILRNTFNIENESESFNTCK